MPRKKKVQNTEFAKYLKEVSKSRRIDEDIVVDAIKEAFIISYTKKLEDELKIPAYSKQKKVAAKSKDGVKLSNALIRFDIDLDSNKMELYHQYKVTKEDDIQDDFIEISDEDPRVVELGLQVGEYYEEPIDLKTFTKTDVTKFINTFNQRISQAEKSALYETFKGKIGEIVTGVVERSDNFNVLVNLGAGREGALATLSSKDLIGNEKYKAGDSIKVYVESIGKTEGKGDKRDNLIKISRSCSDFLKKLFFNEVHEIYDGTIEIKDVARRAGVRSKVAVFSHDKDVDPSGACIGPNGSRIQAIVSQLGNAKDSKEKIDIITYNENKGVYLAECLKPGVVLGIVFDDENNSAKVVCEDDTQTAAIGSKGINVILARQLLGLKEISIISKTEADEQGLVYKTIDEYVVESREEARKKVREESLKKLKEEVTVATVDTKEDFLSKDEDDEEISELPEVSEEKVVEETPVEEVKEPKVEEKVEMVEVNTTISLNELEANLESEKETLKEQPKKKKKEFKVENKEEKKEENKKSVEKMKIYTDEELQELENEDFEDYEDEDSDFSEYDDDSYYEDK